MFLFPENENDSVLCSCTNQSQNSAVLISLISLIISVHLNCHISTMAVCCHKALEIIHKLLYIAFVVIRDYCYDLSHQVCGLVCICLVRPSIRLGVSFSSYHKMLWGTQYIDIFITLNRIIFFEIYEHVSCLRITRLFLLDSWIIVLGRSCFCK